MTARGGGAGCRWCGRDIQLVADIWIDPEATGDDSMWRETCDAHDSFEAPHEPARRDVTIRIWQEQELIASIPLSLAPDTHASINVDGAEIGLTAGGLGIWDESGEWMPYVAETGRFMHPYEIAQL